MSRDEGLIVKSERADTHTMAKLTEALGGESSTSEPRQQLAATKPTDA